ncbi:MAG: acyl-CoA carboxylase biotin carboxyl carrier protein subunit [Planctomycetota bacterium]|jgi:biotin carboxyl carrier protein
MATFHFQVLGRSVTVDVRRDGKRLVLRHDGNEVSFVPTPRGENRLDLRLGNRTVTAVVLRARDGLHVAVEGETYLFRFAKGEWVGAGTAVSAVLGPGAHTLKVPMPGTVAKVLVGEGENVGPDQPLVIVEAMKMENSVRAPSSCRVGRIHVIEGDVVNPGDPLLEMIV